MNTLENLRIFLRVAQTCSFTKTADDLGVNKSRISIVIRQLEDVLGVRLLHRTTRAVHLTEDGLAFYERAVEILSSVDDLQTMFVERTELKGKLRVDMPTDIANSIIIPKLPDFFSRYPGITLELSCTDRRVDLVQEGFDCVVRAGAVYDKNLVAKLIGEMPVFNLASPDYLARKGTPYSIDDLLKYQHVAVHYTPNIGSKPMGWDYLKNGKYEYLNLPGSLKLNNAQSFIAAGLAGIGLIQSPMLGVHNHVERGQLLQILPDCEPEPMKFWFVVAHRHNLSRKVNVFMDWITEQLAPWLTKKGAVRDNTPINR
ncbi:LysR substrate-binding domain-containing protein [Serratia marcescens]|uniref:LysR family transcriptional regulator n=1 Tax=Serratia marcescens TaxID=615 RepID=UPI002B25D1DD|nr:LysR substrate-binding domain-containing protein [Serratia marcescens]WPJ22333.1 LysR substrate-binding domain-containing protein [Serratia marcescens]